MRKSLLAVLILVTTSLQAQTTYFITQTGAGTKDGSNWANAGDSSMVQSFIDAASAGDSIWIAAGKYYPTVYPANCTGCIDYRDYSFTIQKKLFIYGGFEGTESSISQRPTGSQYETRFSGDAMQTLNVDSDNCKHVVVYLNVPVAGILDGISIELGYANGSAAISAGTTIVSIVGRYGGGLYVHNSKINIANCRIANNKADYRGAGIYLGQGAIATITKTGISSNQKASSYYYDLRGGGICVDSTSKVTTDRVAFTYNHAGLGGGAYCVRDTAIFRATVFSSNTADGGGGAIYAGGVAQVSALNSVFYDNEAVSYYGGAVNVYNATASFNYCSFALNRHYGDTANAINLDRSNGYNWGNVYVSNSILFSGEYYTYTVPNWGLASIQSYGSIYAYSFDSIPGLSSYCNVLQTRTYGGISPYANLNSPRGADGVWGTTDDGLQITCSSRAYNKATCSTPPATDITGTARPQNGQSDVGAYELIYTGTPPVIDSIYYTRTNNNDSICYNESWYLTVRLAYHDVATATKYWRKNNGAWTSIGSSDATSFTPSQFQAGDSVQMYLTSTDPCHSGTVYSNWIHLPAPPIIRYDTTSVRISYVPPVCEGIPVTFTADARNAINPTFVWSRYTYGQVGTGSSYTLNNPVEGTSYQYSLVMTTSGGVCTTQTQFSHTISFYPSPRQSTPTITYNSTYNKLTSSTGDVDWYKDGVFTGVHSSTYSYSVYPNVNGCYYVIHDNHSDPCPSAPSNTICVNLCPSIDANFSYSPPLNVCTNQIVTFTSTSSGATSYIWKYKDYNTWQWITFGNSASAIYSFYGNGNNQIRLIAYNGSCVDSIEKNIVVGTGISAPTISIWGNTLSASNYAMTSTLTWYFNGSPISNNPLYDELEAQQTGNYYVVATASNGCSAQSNTILYTAAAVDTISGVADMEQNSFTMIPNPTFSVVTISGLKPNKPIIVTNMLGEVLINTIADAENKVLDVSNLASGVYFVNRKKLVKL